MYELDNTLDKGKGKKDRAGLRPAAAVLGCISEGCSLSSVVA